MAQIIFVKFSIEEKKYILIEDKSKTVYVFFNSRNKDCSYFINVSHHVEQQQSYSVYFRFLISIV